MCLRSIEDSGYDGLLEVVVVDNNSGDGSEACALEMQSVTLIKSGQNLGFAKACNLGAHHSTGEYLLFLNPDSCVYHDTFEKVVFAAGSQNNSKVGIFGVQLEGEMHSVARSCARFPTASQFFFQALGVNRIFPSLGSNMAEWPHDQTMEVDQVIGAFFFVRRELFDRLDGFDERYFVYFEEVDFSLRAKKLGWSSFYLASVQAFHAGGGTSNQVKAKRLFYSLRSRLLYAFKNFSKPDAIGVLLSTLFLELVSRSVFALSKRSMVTLKETWVGYGMLLRWLFERPLSKLKG